MSTNSTTVLVKVSRPEAIRAGFNGTDTIVALSVDVSKLTQTDREEFARRLQYASSYAVQQHGLIPNSPFLCGHGADGKLTNGPIVLVKPTQDGLLDVFREFRQIPMRLEAEKQASVAAATEAANALLVAEPAVFVRSADLYICTEGHIHDYLARDVLSKITYTYSECTTTSYCHADTPKELAAKVRERAAKFAEANKAVKEAARAQAEKDLYEKYWQPLLDWISQYGSLSLQRMCEEGLPWHTLYVEERAAWDKSMFEARLATERPGWVVRADADQIRAPKKPKARAWAMLDAARKVEPAAKLGVLGKRYVAYAEFCDKTIICRA